MTHRIPEYLSIGSSQLVRGHSSTSPIQQGNLEIIVNPLFYKRKLRLRQSMTYLKIAQWSRRL